MTQGAFAACDTSGFTNETWLTPPAILHALGDFDLDPCAAPSPRPWPTAARHIELPEDGLTANWGGARLVQSAVRSPSSALAGQTRCAWQWSRARVRQN